MHPDLGMQEPPQDAPVEQQDDEQQDDGQDAAPAGLALELAPDAVCAAAVDLARSAAQEVAASRAEVGEHIGVEAEGDRLVTHSFACLSAGYRGWRWAVTLARAPRSRAATVCEVVLLPSSEAILAPAWVPWSDRIAPGDLGRADVLPYRADDPNLDPGYAATGDEDADRIAIWELGLGRVRVLSAQGRDAAARRWYTGSSGPTAESAIAASAACATCGYFLALSGALRNVFGVCANEWSPSDGQVVSLDHGCGAHSETDVERAEPEPLPPPVLDETGAEAVVVRRAAPAPVEAEQVEAEQGETQQVETQQVETQQVETQQVEVEPVEAAAPDDTTAAVAPDDAPDEQEPAQEKTPSS